MGVGGDTSKSFSWASDQNAKARYGLQCTGPSSYVGVVAHVLAEVPDKPMQPQLPSCTANDS